MQDAVTDAVRGVARAVSLGRLDAEEAETTLGEELDSRLPEASVELGQEASEPTILVSEEADAVVIDVTVPLRDLL